MKIHSSAFDNNDLKKQKTKQKNQHIFPKPNSVPLRPFHLTQMPSVTRYRYSHGQTAV